MVSPADIDLVFQGFQQLFAEKMAVLLGRKVAVVAIDHQLLSVGRLFESMSDHQVLTRIELEGTEHGECLVFADFAGALILGGTLIMLPEDEVSERAKAKKLGSDVEDAYGEIVNICCGFLSKLFSETCQREIRFVKRSVFAGSDQRDLRAAWESEHSEVLTSRVSWRLPGKGISGTLTFIFPTRLAKVGSQKSAVTDEGLVLPETPEGPVSDPDRSERRPGLSTGPDEGGAPGQADDGRPAPLPVVVVMTDAGGADLPLDEALAGLTVDYTVIHISDDLRAALGPEPLCGIILVMGEVQEQGIAAAIKVKSTVDPRVPLLAVGPNWTRSMVLRAIKYGVRDILVSPASVAQIQDKVRTNFLA